MRVGKKPNVVEAKKTRSCVVRLEKVPSPPPIKVTRGRNSGMGATVKSSPQQDEKNVKGPLKKRPITQVSTSLATATPKSKEKITKATPTATTKMTARAPTPVVYETPPTIAAGRSRRAIKPNPKYASEDMITPKLIKLVSSTQKRGGNAIEKERKNSTSSSDFFNKESSDETGDGEINDLQDKPYIVDIKDSDSDISDIEDEEEETRPTPRPRGRPKKEENKRSLLLSTPASAAKTTAGTSVLKSSSLLKSVSLLKSTSLLKSGSTVKSTPSQLQQLRKTLSASVTRPTATTTTTTVTLGNKRKREPGNDAENESGITRKRFLLAPTNKLKTTSEMNDKDLQVNNKIPTTTRKSLLNLNGSKTAIAQESEDNEQSSARKLPVEKRAFVKTKLINAKTNTLLAQTKSNTSKVLASSTGNKRSFSPSTPKTASKDVELDDDEKSKLEASPSSTTDDFETMPTFTIVNINDIINKKGDVLISKAAAAKNSAAKSNAKSHDSPKTNTSDITATSPAVATPASTTTSPETKLSRRKAGHTTILSEKIDPERLKNPAARTPFPPKNAASKPPTILNHTLGTKTAINQRRTRGSPTVSKSDTVGTSPDKPAPRILNSMVAKKTQPVKPMIANLDDSADESYPLSIEDDDDDDINEEEDVVEEEEEEDEKESDDIDFDSQEDEVKPTFLGKRKNKSKSTPFHSKPKKTVPATKENFLAATNRMPAKSTLPQRKLSPEKVVISRQGDKIIKKITCFETWYVINAPEERPDKVVRNLLEIPLIKLANVASDINVPSASWSSKVTLYELSATTIAKSTLLTYTGDLKEHNISEEDRTRYQPSCVMFRRAVNDRQKSRLPYDRAVIFKSKTFFTNIEGKNVKLVGAPITINNPTEVEILLQIVDSLTLQSALVEPATTVQ